MLQMKILGGPLTPLAIASAAASVAALLTIAQVTPYHAAIVVDAASGRVLYEYQADMPWPPASMTKMMLLLVADESLEAGLVSPDMSVRISSKAAATEGKALHLHAGEVYPLVDLMRATLIASANDAAVAVAQAMAGSTEECVHLMNEEARRIGLDHTHYATVNGLPTATGRDQDVTTASDLATLARHVIYDSKLLDWSRENLFIAGPGARRVANTNNLLREFPGCDGIKTGYTYKSGFSLTATAKRHDLRLIVVILGAGRSSERFHEAARLLQWGFDNYAKMETRDEGVRFANPALARSNSNDRLSAR